jgi:predicted  nucleic acid-binding Zn-ribbon protein
MNDCLECLKAKQRAVHMVYAEGCRLCGARKLAYMARGEREKVFDAIQHVSGYAMRREAERLVALERARIAALAEAKPKERET